MEEAAADGGLQLEVREFLLPLVVLLDGDIRVVLDDRRDLPRWRLGDDAGWRRARRAVRRPDRLCVVIVLRLSLLLGRRFFQRCVSNQVSARTQRMNE